MKGFKQKIFFIILSIFLCLLPVLASCSNNTADNTDNSGDNNANASGGSDNTEINRTDAENIYDQFPKTDFGGRDFTMLLVDYLAEEHYSESETGDIFNDAVYSRNKKIEEDYNIYMNFKMSPLGTVNEDLRKSVLAEDGAYDLAAVHAVSAASILTAGLYTDWHTVPVINENLDNPWWNKSVVKDLSIGNKCFFIAGDIGYLYLAQNHAFIFNKKLFQDAGMDSPYKMVKDGTWTYSTFSALIKDLNTDINGDGTLDIKDDTFGFVTMGYFADTMYFFNFGGKITEKDENDYPILSLNNQKNAAIIETGYDWFINGNCPIVPYTGNDDYTQELAHIAFRDDRAYFLGTNLKNLRVLRNMDSEYGIVPYPKFDETQGNYISNVEGAATMLILPRTADGDYVGVITEALARESSLSVIPAYYETTLQQKFARDEETIDMLKIIRDTASFDFGYIYNIGGVGFLSKELLEQKSMNLASYYEKKERVIQSAIDKLVKYCETLN